MGLSTGVASADAGSRGSGGGSARSGSFDGSAGAGVGSRGSDVGGAVVGIIVVISIIRRRDWVGRSTDGRSTSNYANNYGVSISASFFCDASFGAKVNVLAGGASGTAADDGLLSAGAHGFVVGAIGRITPVVSGEVSSGSIRGECGDNGRGFFGVDKISSAAAEQTGSVAGAVVRGDGNVDSIDEKVASEGSFVNLATGPSVWRGDGDEESFVKIDVKSGVATSGAVGRS